MSAQKPENAQSRGKKKHRNLKRACDKRRYRDHGEAIQALRRVREAGGRETVPVRAYECQRCHGWHLTSQVS